MLVVNAANIEKDWNWIKPIQYRRRFDGRYFIQNLPAGCTGTQCHPHFAAADLHGSHESEVLHFVKGEFAGVKNVLISATGYTGAGGVEIYFEDKNDAAEKIWDAIFTAGKSLGLKPAGLAARDTLRLEMGYCLYGNDIDDSTSPLEAGLGLDHPFLQTLCRPRTH